MKLPVRLPLVRPFCGLTFMKKLCLVLTLAAAAASPLSAADPARIYSNPAVPPREALDRLRLKAAWTVTVPTDGRRDGLLTVQLLPREKGMDLVVQTRSGGVTCYDATTGLLLWATRVGTPYRASQPLAYNRDTLFAINNIDLIALDRATGRQLWEYDLPSGAAAPPVADDTQIYISLTNNRLVTYELPNLVLWEKLVRETKARGMTTKEEAARALKGIDLPAIGPLSGVHEALRMPHTGPQPVQRFSYAPDDRVEVAPVLSADRVLLTGVGGQIAAITRVNARTAWRPFYAHGRIRVPIGQYDETAYVASNDYNVYAVSISAGRVFWRFPVGGVPTDRPAALDEDLYVAADRAGLVRVDRAGGDERWRNGDAARYLASNKKFVYAADHNGRLLVIDRGRGTTLSSYDGTRDFVLPIQNEWTDRVYLAAHDGLIVCLHDRDSEAPVVMKAVKERAPLPPPGGGKPAPPEPPKAGGGAVKPKAPGGAMDKP
jgi:outer membrane protein assembly factor BamB